MPKLKITNNAVSRLSANISSADTSISLLPGGGAKFPTLAVGEWFPATFVKVDGTLEIVRVIARATDVLTVVRGQEATAAISFSAGDRVEHRFTAGAMMEEIARLDLSTAELLEPSGAGKIGFDGSETYADGTVGSWLKSLSSAIGASLILWKRAFAGAIARTLAEWIQEFEMTPREFGCACDGTTIDNVAFGKLLDAAKGRWVVIPDGDLVRLTQSPTSLTTYKVRIRGRSNQYHTGQQIIAAGRDYGGILLDGVDTSLGGTWDLATNTVTYPQRIKGVQNLVIAGINGARHGLLDFLDNALIHGVHFQDFTDHHMFTFGSILNSYRDISGYGALLGKSASGTWLGGDFINGCGWLCTGSAPSGVAGNFLAGKAFGSGNFSSTSDVSNVFFDTAITNTTSGKGFIFYNTRSITMKNCGSYSGVYQAFCNIHWDSPHMETYATGGEVAGDGNKQSFVALNCTSQTTNYDGATILPPVILRTTPFTAGTDYWGYNLQTGARWQFSRIGVNELILGEKLAAGSTVSQHVAAIGTADNPMVIWDKVMNALRCSKGNSFAPILGMPICITTTIPATGFRDINSNDLIPAVNAGSGPGGIYDIDVQIFDKNNGNIFYAGSWVGVRQIVSGQYGTRFYSTGHVDNNPPVGGVTVTESNTGVYSIRITNNSAFILGYSLVSRLRVAALPFSM